MKNITQVILLLFFSFSLYSQSQVGSTIYSINEDECFGREIAMSLKGDRVFVAGPCSDFLVQNGGTVRVYDEVEDEWEFIYEINGTQKAESLGFNIAMTPDGKKFVTTGRLLSSSDYFIIIYEEQNGGLEIIGDTIITSGYIRDLVISDDGNRIAISKGITTDYGQGILQMYDLVNDQWELMPFSIYGDEYNQMFGDDIDMSADGTRIIIGDKKYNKDFSLGGQVKVYDLIEEEWVQVGQTFMADNAGENVGYQVNMSKDGNLIAVVQGRQFIPGVYPTAHLNIYEFDGGTWVPKGETVTGTEDFNTITFELDLSDNGKDLILGEYRYGEEYDLGKAIHYRFLNGQWQPSEVAIYGENEHDALGAYVAISGDGNRFAAGAPRINDFSYLKVYEFKNTANTFQEKYSGNWNVFPNPSTGSFTLVHEGGIKEYNLTIYNQVGTKIYSTFIYDSSSFHNIDLPAGLYFLDLSIGNQHSIKKFSILD